MNFDFLRREDGYYDLFADACIEAEKIYATSPAMCAVGCRKALELAVKWVYAADSAVRPQDAILSLRALFDFVDWIDYCYGPDYEERVFDER